MTFHASDRLVPVTVNRIEIEAHVPFEALRRAFEAEVPLVDSARFEQLVADGAEWKRFAQEAEGNGIHRFVAFWRHYPSAIMRVGGADIPSASYLIGDYVTASRVFRHDPAAMLYTPTRIELHAGRNGGTILTVDQPSSQLVSLGNNKITQAGYELDRMLGDLLEELGLPRPEALRR